jgi:hypothetical protein
VWWHTPGIPALGRQRQKDPEFKASLNYIASPKTICLKRKCPHCPLSHVCAFPPWDALLWGPHRSWCWLSWTSRTLLSFLPGIKDSRNWLDLLQLPREHLYSTAWIRLKTEAENWRTSESPPGLTGCKWKKTNSREQGPGILFECYLSSHK